MINVFSVILYVIQIANFAVMEYVRNVILDIS